MRVNLQLDNNKLLAHNKISIWVVTTPEETQIMKAHQMVNRIWVI